MAELADLENIVWRMNGATALQTAKLATGTDPNWRVISIADFDGDGKADILWRHAASGSNSIWFMNGVTQRAGGALLAVDPTWSIVATGDYNGDGRADILWRNSTGNNVLWLMNGATMLSATTLPAVTDVNWKVVAP